MSLIGDLAELKIADVLQLFAAGKKSGRLTVSAEQEQTVLRFQRGALVEARGTGGRLLGDEAVLDLFGWVSGQLTFIPGERTAASNVGRSLDELIREGLRVGTAFHKMNEAIPSDRVIFHTTEGPTDGTRLSLGASEWRVVRLVDGVRDVKEIVEASGLARPDVVRILFELGEAGFLTRSDPQRALRAVAHGLFGRRQADLDPRVMAEWRKMPRFMRAILRVEVRSAAGRRVALTPNSRVNIGFEVHLPRAALTELQIKEGDDVQVRPVG